MGCAFEDDLTAYVDGELPATRMKEVEVHLTGCASCRATEGLLRRTVAQLAALPAPAFEPTPRLRREVLARIDEPTLWERLKGLLRPVVLVPSLGAVAAAAVLFVATRHRGEAVDINQLELASNLEVASNMEMLEDYDVLGVDSPDDLEVVQHLHELEATP